MDTRTILPVPQELSCSCSPCCSRAVLATYVCLLPQHPSSIPFLPERELGFRRSAAGTLNRWCVINELQIRNNTSRPADCDFIIIIFTPVISVVKALRSLQSSVFAVINFPSRRTPRPRYTLKLTLIPFNFMVFPSTFFFFPCCTQQTHWQGRHFRLFL